MTEQEKFNKAVWVCKDCGIKYGNQECGIAARHTDECDVCGKITMCTEPRDFLNYNKT